MHIDSLALAIGLLAVCPLPSGAAQSSDLQGLLDTLREEAGAPGAILGIYTEPGQQQVIASGYADRETRRSMSPEAPYYLGSISKAYTAVIVLRLAEEGRLKLDDTLDHFLPSFPEGSKINIRHLLAQTSGLKDFYEYLYYRPDREEMIAFVTKEWTQPELLDLAGRFGRWFEPGTDWGLQQHELLPPRRHRRKGQRIVARRGLSPIHLCSTRNSRDLAGLA